MPRRNTTLRNCKVCKRSRRLSRWSSICRSCHRILNPPDFTRRTDGTTKEGVPWLTTTSITR